MSETTPKREAKVKVKRTTEDKFNTEFKFNRTHVLGDQSGKYKAVGRSVRQIQDCRKISQANTRLLIQ